MGSYWFYSEIDYNFFKQCFDIYIYTQYTDEEEIRFNIHLIPDRCWRSIRTEKFEQFSGIYKAFTDWLYDILNVGDIFEDIFSKNPYVMDNIGLIFAEIKEIIIFYNIENNVKLDEIFYNCFGDESSIEELPEDLSIKIKEIMKEKAIYLQ